MYLPWVLIGWLDLLTCCNVIGQCEYFGFWFYNTHLKPALSFRQILSLQTIIVHTKASHSCSYVPRKLRRAWWGESVWQLRKWSCISIIHCWGRNLSSIGLGISDSTSELNENKHKTSLAGWAMLWKRIQNLKKVTITQVDREFNILVWRKGRPIAATILQCSEFRYLILKLKIKTNQWGDSFSRDKQLCIKRRMKRRHYVAQVYLSIAKCSAMCC